MWQLRHDTGVKAMLAVHKRTCSRLLAQAEALVRVLDPSSSVADLAAFAHRSTASTTTAVLAGSWVDPISSLGGTPAGSCRGLSHPGAAAAADDLEVDDADNGGADSQLD